MTHEKLSMHITPEWALAQANLENDDDVTSVGGLAHEMGILRAGAGQQPSPPPVDAKRQSLGRLVKLLRRQRKVTAEQLADQADVDLGELLAIENAADVQPEARTLYQLSEVFGMPVDPLLELAGLVDQRSNGLTQSAFRFAARSESMAALTKEEEEALNQFVGELSKL